MSEDQKYPSQLAERFQVRMPEGLRDEIKLSADVNGRSMNAEIIHRLKNAFYTPEKEGYSRIYLPDDVYQPLMLDAYGRGVDPDERAVEIIAGKYDPQTEYKQLVDALAEEKLKSEDILEQNHDLKQDQERDFVLYYGKALQISQFIETLLRDAGDALPPHIQKAAADLEALNQAELTMLRARYEEGLFRLKRRENAAANEKSIATGGE